MEWVLLFAPLSLQGLRTGQLKIALGSPRGAEWCSRLGETRVFVKNRRFAHTRAPFGTCAKVLTPGPLLQN